MKRFTMIAIVAFLPFLATACNTMQGAGEDISKGGQAIENSADKNKNY